MAKRKPSDPREAQARGGCYVPPKGQTVALYEFLLISMLVRIFTLTFNPVVGAVSRQIPALEARGVTVVY